MEERGKSGEKCTFVFDWFKLFCWVMCWQIVVMTPGLCSESFTVSVLWSQTRDSESNFWNRLDPVQFIRTRTVAVSLGYCLMDKMKSLRGGVYSRSLKLCKPKLAQMGGCWSGFATQVFFILLLILTRWLNLGELTVTHQTGSVTQLHNVPNKHYWVRVSHR